MSDEHARGSQRWRLEIRLTRAQWEDLGAIASEHRRTRTSLVKEWCDAAISDFRDRPLFGAFDRRQRVEPIAQERRAEVRGRRRYDQVVRTCPDASGRERPPAR